MITKSNQFIEAAGLECKWVSFLILPGVPVVAQQVSYPTSIHKDEGLIPHLAQWGKDPDLVLPQAVV